MSHNKPTPAPADGCGPEVIKSYLKTLPGRPGVYRMLDQHGEVLYVGKAKNLKNRVTSYTRTGQLTTRIAGMVAKTASMVFVTVRSEAEALLLEANYIKRFMPPFNVILKDDKSFPYIRLTLDHPWPQISKYRGLKSKDAEYFGPFASAQAVTRTLNALQKMFLLRSCSDAVLANRSRPCLLYQIKRCAGPCAERVSAEDYAALVAETRAFLAGKASRIRDDLTGRMTEAAVALDFETAAMLRDRLRALAAVQTSQSINLMSLGDADVVALHRDAGWASVQIFFYRQGQNWGHRAHFLRVSADDSAEEALSAFLAQFYEDKPPPALLLVNMLPPDAPLIMEALSERAGRKVMLSVPQRGEKAAIVAQAAQNAREALSRRLAESSAQSRLLEGVAELFELDGSPERIEIYDNSHLGGTQMVGAMVVAGSDGFRKQAYRKFNIKGADVAGGDDYAMMREVMRRRFARLQQEDETRERGHWPDLVLIDGGAGQLSAVTETLDELGIEDVPLVAISKGVDRNAGRETFHMPGREPFQMPHTSPVLYYLQRLRDEAHRFAIGAQRTRRHVAMSDSPLDSLPGVGAARKKALLHHFGSAKAVRAAGVDDLARVPGISRALAEKIHGHFNG